MPDQQNERSAALNDRNTVERLIGEHLGWAESIARNVARAWNLDWQMDGLDGGAYEGLLFCASRFNDSLGVPFRAYARKRVHEAATEEARKSKSWRRATGSTELDEQSREISARLFQLYPELRSGYLETSTDSDDGGMQIAVKTLLASASLLFLADEQKTLPEDLVEYREMLSIISNLSPVHQDILWQIYWMGKSMRTLATEWQIDELTIIREHSSILSFLEEILKRPDSSARKELKIRPTLRKMLKNYADSAWSSPFSGFRKTKKRRAVDFLIVVISLLATQHFFPQFYIH